MDLITCGNEEIKSPYKGDVSSHLEVIDDTLSVKVENSHSTPNKLDNLQNFHNTDCKNTKSPCKNTFLFNEKHLLKSPLFKSPTFKRWDKSVDTTRPSACLQRKRTFSANSDYDIFKSELYVTESFHNFEGIDLSHDLDSIIKFEDSKVPSDIILSSIIDVNTAQETDDNLLRVNEDPVTDPLSLSDHERKDTDALPDSDSKFNGKNRIKVGSKRQIKRRWLIRFEDSKVPSDIILSSIMDVNTAQETDDNLLGVNKDPVTDPLSLSDHEGKDTDTLPDSDSKFNEKNIIKVESKRQRKRRRSIRFEDSKVPSDILSSIMDVNTAHEIDDNLLGVNKDSVTDPLSISDHEEKGTDPLPDSDSKFDEKNRIKVESKHRIKRRLSTDVYKKCPFKKQKLNKEEKHLLGELNNIDDQEELLLIDRKKLQELHIKLIHKVPLQHKIELTGSHAPTRKEKRLFQRYGPIRKGLYTPVEDKVIRSNWETFCKLHDWDIKKAGPFLNWKHNGKYYIDDVRERQKFVRFLANGLPWRTLYSIYSRFKILHRNKITHARYTSKEDKKILMYIDNKYLDKRDTKYTELAKLLKRTNRSIFKRYQYLKRTKNESEKEPLDNIKWTLPLIKKFIKTLLNVTLSEDIRELKDAILPKPIWQKMEEKLNIHENVLKTFWQHQLHLQLFSTGSIYLNSIKIKLIEYMYGKGISNTREIIWPNVARYFDGATAVFLCKVFFYLVQECNMNDVDNFADIMEYLYHTKIPEIEEASTDKFLPRIIYENGKISLYENSGTADVNHQETDHNADSNNDI